MVALRVPGDTFQDRWLTLNRSLPNFVSMDARDGTPMKRLGKIGCKMYPVSPSMPEVNRDDPRASVPPLGEYNKSPSMGSSRTFDTTILQVARHVPIGFMIVGMP